MFIYQKQNNFINSIKQNLYDIYTNNNEFQNSIQSFLGNNTIVLNKDYCPIIKLFLTEKNLDIIFSYIISYKCQGFHSFIKKIF